MTRQRERALQILFDTYWTPKGCRLSPVVSPEDFAIARQAGVMFDPFERSHADLFDWLELAFQATRLEEVSNAFLASLSTRRLELRSALGSYAFARHFPRHAYQDENGFCAVCGIWGSARREHDLNVLNFERFKWGGVRHVSPEYAAFDLTQLARLEPVTPVAQDLEIMRNIIDTARQCPPEARPRDLEKRLAGVLKSNKSEREILIQILAYCGILQPAHQPGYFDGFVPYSRRLPPLDDRTYWTYPICWWRGADGVNLRALAHYFPALAG